IQDASLDRQSQKLMKLYKRLCITNPASESRPRISESRSLIVCCGPRFDRRAQLAVEEIGNRFGLRSHMFVMHEWIAPEHLEEAKAVLILSGASVADVTPLLKHGIPLVAPAESVELTNLCRRYECGLFYETSQEAAECLVWLCENPANREQLAL